MNIKTLGWLLGVTALASSTSIVACSQASVQCQVGHAGSGLPYAAKYYAVGTPGATCASKGDQIGFETYHPKGGGDNGEQPDFSVPSNVAFQNDSLGGMIAGRKGRGLDPEGVGSQDPSSGAHIAPKRAPYASGKFTTVEPVDDFCVVTDLVPAEQDFTSAEAVPPDPMDPMDPGLDALPASTMKYEWSDVKVYVTAASLGTQFAGHLKYTQDTCSAEYNVAGVWPAVSCGVDKDVDDGMGGMMKITVPQESLCCPSADPLGGRITGSGINPDFPLKCDPDLLLCVLDTADPTKLPVLKPGWSADADGNPAGACKITADTGASP